MISPEIRAVALDAGVEDGTIVLLYSVFETSGWNGSRPVHLITPEGAGSIAAHLPNVRRLRIGPRRCAVPRRVGAVE